jgi:hypothetical protein
MKRADPRVVRILQIECGPRVLHVDAACHQQGFVVLQTGFLDDQETAQKQVKTYRCCDQPCLTEGAMEALKYWVYQNFPDYYKVSGGISGHSRQYYKLPSDR